MRPLFLAFVLTVSAFGADWQVGLGRVDITPEENIPMAGYASRTAPFEAVEERIHAKALAIQDETGSRSLLITADLLGFPAELADSIAGRIGAESDLERGDILFNASHTHSAPLVAGSLLQTVDADIRGRISRYIDQLEDKVVEAGLSALDDLQAAELAWGRGVAHFPMNRREFTERGVILGVNPRGLADRTVPVLRVAGESGELRAVVFGAGSHCTTLGGRYMRINGDYAGYAQKYVEAREPGVQAMFVTGCAGDANPYPRGEQTHAQQHGSELADAVMDVLAGELEPVGGPLTTTFERVELPLRNFTRDEIEEMDRDAPGYRKFFTETALKKLDKGEELLETYAAPFAVWQFGDDLTLVAFSGETVVDYARFAEERLGHLDLWISGYNNDLFGYLPSARVLEEGGYETRGLYADYGLFPPRVEDVVMEAVVKLAREAGRQIP